MQKSHELFIEESDGVYETVLFGFTDEEAMEISLEVVEDAEAMELWNGDEEVISIEQRSERLIGESSDAS